MSSSVTPSSDWTCCTCVLASGFAASAWATAFLALAPTSPKDAASHELAGTRSSSVGVNSAGSFASSFRSVVPRMRTPLSVAPNEKPTLRTAASWDVS